MKIKSITIEGMHNITRKTYDFDDVNYFYGENGIGKSTILQAIQLSLLGYIPGYSKTNESIFSHANSHIMSVTLYLIDNISTIKITRTYTKNKGKVSAICDIVPDTIDLESIVKDIELPIFNFSDLLNLSNNKLKDWFISFLPKSTEQFNWNDIFEKYRNSDTVSELIENLITYSTTCSTDIDGIRNMNAYLKSLLSFKKSEIKRIQDTISSLVHYDDIDIEMSTDEIKSEIDMLNQQLNQYMQTNTIINQNLRIEKQLEEFSDLSDDPNNDEIIQQYRQNIDNLEQSYIDIQSQIDALNKKLISLNSEYTSNQKIIEGKGICPYSGTTCNTIQSTLKSLKECQDVLYSDIQKYNQKLTELKNQYNQLHFDIKDLKDKLHHRTVKYDKRYYLKSQLTDYPTVTVDPTYCKDRLNYLQNQMVKILANQKYEDMMEFLTQDKFRLDFEISALNDLIKLTDANNLQMDLSTAPFIAFADDISKYFQLLSKSSDTASFNLSTKSNSFSFGIVRDSAYIPFDQLSSGEKCIYTLSIMIAMIKCNKCNLPVILIDDLFDHLDDTKCDLVFDGIANIDDVQFIFAGVKGIKNLEIVKSV